MNDFDIDKFMPKFPSKDEIYQKVYDYNMKLISLDIDEKALLQMLYHNQISENEYLKMKNKIEKKRNELK